MDVSEVREKAWETHSSWSMEVTVYIFCYLCVKCSLNEGHYLTIYCWFSPKGGKMDIPKAWLSRQENGIGINSKRFFRFVPWIPPGSCGWFVWVTTKGKRREAARKEGIQRQGFLPEELRGGDTFPVLSLAAKNCSKLDQARPLIPALCLQPVITDFPLVPPGDGNIWEAGMAKVTAICRGKNSRRNSAEMKICFYALPRQSPRVLINVRYGARWNNLREAGICLQMPHNKDPCFLLLNFISFQLRVRQSWINGRAKPGCFGKFPLGMRAQGKDGSLKSLRKYSWFFRPQGGVGGI